MYDREAEKGKKINERGILIGESTVLIESTKERISTVNSFVLFLRFYYSTVAMNRIK